MIKQPLEPVRFGFLQVPWAMGFTGGSISPISEYEEISLAVEKQLSSDGFLYPPRIKCHETRASGYWRSQPKKTRPGFLHPVWPSHDLHLLSAEKYDDVYDGPASFVVHCLSFLFKTRLQFASWFFDGRIPISNFQHRFTMFSRPVAEAFLSQGYEAWRGWEQSEQVRFTNILYMHSRVNSYEWDWEQFILEYMVLDACWKMAECLFGLRARRHADRPKALRDKFGLFGEDFLEVEKMVKLRNDLFHEAMWYEGRPTVHRRRQPYSMAIRLRCFNHALIVALMKIPPGLPWR